MLTLHPVTVPIVVFLPGSLDSSRARAQFTRTLRSALAAARGTEREQALLRALELLSEKLDDDDFRGHGIAVVAGEEPIAQRLHVAAREHAHLEIRAGATGQLRLDPVAA